MPKKKKSPALQSKLGKVEANSGATPGPYWVDEARYIRSPKRQYLAGVFSYSEKEAKGVLPQEANAALFAASWDLLKALQEAPELPTDYDSEDGIRAFAEVHLEWEKKRVAAIRKAEPHG